MIFFFAALSRAEKAFFRFVGVGFFLAAETDSFIKTLLRKLIAALRLSARSFRIAPTVTGISAI